MQKLALSPAILDSRLSTLTSNNSSVRDFLALLKPGVMSLVVFSGLAGILIAPGPIHPFIAAIAVLCIALGSGASGAINMWYDSDIDAIMKRTKNRPIPAGKIARQTVLEFGVVAAITSVVIMFVAVNALSAALLLSAILFYIFIYTMGLKRRTPQNIVIGGAAGAFPPMIGWATVTNTISLESVLLFAIIFLWTPPHFWALALYRSDDYAKAGIPMLPVVSGTRVTKFQMLIYTLILVPVTLAPFYLHMMGVLYTMGAGILGAIFLYHAIRVWADKSDNHKRAMKMFGFSILYLFLLFGLMIIDVYARKWGIKAV